MEKFDITQNTAQGDFMLSSLDKKSIMFIYLIIFLLYTSISSGQIQLTNKNIPPIPSNAQNPALALEPTLLPEAVYALNLVEILGLEPTSDANKAEILLSRLGIEPKNGWISDYPITPMIIGDIDQDIANAYDLKKINLNKTETLKQVNELKTRLGLDVEKEKPNHLTQATPNISKANNANIYSYIDNKGMKHFTDNYASIPSEYLNQVKTFTQTTHSATVNVNTNPRQDSYPNTGNQAIAYPDQNIINNYYLNQGPPVITYYTPPQAYNYLYNWAAYPFWYAGVYFPGFYVLNNFYRTIDYRNQQYYLRHQAGPNQTNFSSQNNNMAGWYTNKNAESGAQAISEFEEHHNRLNRFNDKAFNNAVTSLPTHIITQPQIDHHFPDRQEHQNQPNFPNNNGNFNLTPGFQPPIQTERRGFEEQQLINPPHNFTGNGGEFNNGGGEFHNGGGHFEGHQSGGFRGGGHR